MKKKGFFGLFLFFLAFLSTLNIGFGDWNHVFLNYSGGVATQKDFQTSTVVAKVKGTSTKNYSDLGRALKEAYENDVSETILVVPSSDGMNEVSLTTEYGTLSSSDGRYHYTVASNDTLLLPYDEAGSYDSIDSFGRTTNTSDSPSDVDPNTWCKLRVTMEENVAIDCYGALRIGGEVGGDNPQGATHGRYAELVMGKNTLLTMGNGSTATDLWCHGFIRDTEEYQDTDSSADNEYTKIILNSGATANEPMTVYDWLGAGYVLSRMGADVFIFNIYELTNIRPKMKINYGASLVGQAYMHGGIIGNVETEGRIVGSASQKAFLMTNAGSSIIWNFDSATDIYKTGGQSATGHSCAISTYGNVSASSFSVSVSGYDINSADYYFPIPYQYDIHVKEGTISLDSALKFLPGSEVYVDDGAFVEIKDNVIFYADTKGGQDTAIPRYPSSLASTPAKLVNNGTIIASNVSVTATILTEASKTKRGQIKFTNCSSVSDCYECTPTNGGTATKHGPYQFGRQCYYMDGTSTEAALTDIANTTNWISRAGNAYYEDVPMADISYSFDLSALSSGAQADTNFTSNLRFSVDGVAYSNSATSFQVIEGEEFTISDYYGISHFLINGERVESGTTLSQSEVTSIVAVASSDYAVNISIGTSDLTAESTVTVNAMDASTGLGTHIALSASSTGSAVNVTGYVSSSARLSIVCGGNALANTLVVTGATLGSDGSYYPEGTVSISVSTEQAKEITSATMSVDRYIAYFSDSDDNVAGGSDFVFTLAPNKDVVIKDVTWHILRSKTVVADGDSTEERESLSDHTTPSFDSAEDVTTKMTINAKSGTNNTQWQIKLTGPTTDGDNYYKYYYYQVTADITDSYGKTLKGVVLDNDATNHTNFIVSYSYNSDGCIVEGSMITMSDGTQKAVEDVNLGDSIKSWDFSVGGFVDQKIVFYEETASSEQEIVTVHFDDGTYLETVAGQSYFDIDKLEYFNIDSTDASNIGKRVLGYDDGSKTIKTVVDVTSERREVAFYDIVTSYSYNFVANGVVNIVPFLFNLNTFEITEDLIYDFKRMAVDIATYGLYTWEDFESLGVGTEEHFDVFNAKYLKVAVGKGLVSFEQILNWYDRYKGQSI